MILGGSVTHSRSYRGAGRDGDDVVIAGTFRIHQCMLLCSGEYTNLTAWGSCWMAIHPVTLVLIKFNLKFLAGCIRNFATRQRWWILSLRMRVFPFQTFVYVRAPLSFLHPVTSQLPMRPVGDQIYSMSNITCFGRGPRSTAPVVWYGGHQGREGSVTWH